MYSKVSAVKFQCCIFQSLSWLPEWQVHIFKKEGHNFSLKNTLLLESSKKILVIPVQERKKKLKNLLKLKIRREKNPNFLQVPIVHIYRMNKSILHFANFVCFKKTLSNLLLILNWAFPLPEACKNISFRDTSQVELTGHHLTDDWKKNLKKNQSRTLKITHSTDRYRATSRRREQNCKRICNSG